MKRIIVLALVFTMVFSVCLTAARADSATFTQDAFVFERLENGSWKLIEYTDRENQGTVNIPSTVDGQLVERIGKYAFEECRAKVINIPESVKIIENAAFNNCSGIQKITIPNGVLFVDGNPFTGCINLVNISVDPKHPTLQVTTDGALYSMRNKMLLCYPCSKEDAHFTVKEGTLSIGKGAFRTCDKLESIILPDTVTEIYEEAFLGCTKLSKVVLPNSLLKIGELAFSGCVSLDSITIPEKVSRIEKSTFFNCSMLQSVSLPQELTDIFDMAFFGCKSLKSVSMPKTMSTIGEKAFANCSSLEEVQLPYSVTKIGDAAFANCSVRLYLYVYEYSFAEIYAKINDISFRYDRQDDFLNESY